MAYTTQTEIPNAVNVIVQSILLKNAKARCPYFLGSTPAEIMRHGNSFTARWRDYGNLTPTTTPLTPLTGTPAYPTRTGSQATVTNVDAVVQKYGDFLTLNEEVVVVNMTAQAAKFAEILGIQAGRSLNRLQRNELEDNSVIRYANGVANDAAVITAIAQNDIDFVVNALHNNSAMTFTPMSTGSANTQTLPILPAFWGICHVDVAHDVKGLTGFRPVSEYAGQVATANGEFGYTPSAGAGVRWVMTEEGSIDVDAGGAAGSLRSNLGTSADLYSPVIFGTDYHGSVGFGEQHIQEIYQAGDPLPAVQLISHGPGTAGTADPLDEVSTTGWKSWHAAKVLKAIWGRAIRVGATDI